ncbi:hypothetical protein KUTeg_023351 [Tegillarca granosa]|uniref:HECT domain-containing protein n=1 Tax=Tegillarca granosa TaxID=220873 RepID=A0ABQ9E6B8_TEGGR|nr:hypothetical protein KUTeg_023351 [Tegillarca granosa]
MTAEVSLIMLHRIHTDRLVRCKKKFNLRYKNIHEQSVDLYQFLTSMRDMPSRPQDLHVAFNYQRPQDKFPRAITCGNLLLLPLGNESNKEFLYFFKKALNYKSSFGRI